MHLLRWSQRDEVMHKFTIFYKYFKKLANKVLLRIYYPWKIIVYPNVV